MKLGVDHDALGGRFNYNTDMANRNWYFVSEDDLILLAQNAFQTARSDRNTKVADLHYWKSCVASPALRPWTPSELIGVRDAIDKAIESLIVFGPKIHQEPN